MAEDDELFGSERGQPHGAVRVQFGRGNTDLGAEAEAATVVEAGGRVDDDTARVDVADELARLAQIAGEDRFGVSATILADVPDSRGEIVDNGDEAAQFEELLARSAVCTSVSS